MNTRAWLITRAGRGNPDTTVDGSRDAEAAWSAGNLAQPLIHGVAYFAALAEAVRAMRAEDLLLFCDWRGDPDQALDNAGTEIAALLSDAARRGVLVRGLIWRSHFDRLRFSEQENRSLSEAIDTVEGCCLLDMRVRPFGSHHQKFVVLRHPGRPQQDVAFVGGVDLCHGRRDDAEHRGDVQAAPIAGEYGRRPPWHDAHLAIRGPAVREVETVFRERWEDRAPLSRNPLHRLKAYTSGEDTEAVPLPAQLPAPAPCGPHSVALLRTYPRRRGGYPFATRGEQSIAAGYRKALKRAGDLIYLEDQYLWSRQVAEPFAQALRENPQLRLIAVLPLWPAEEGRVARSAMLVGRNEALDSLYEAGGDRVAVYGIENHAGTPVYVHAKIAVIDDVWASVGSGNLNRRSWTHDSELSCAVLDQTPDPREPRTVGGRGEFARVFARELRLTLALETPRPGRPRRVTGVQVGLPGVRRHGRRSRAMARTRQNRSTTGGPRSALSQNSPIALGHCLGHPAVPAPVRPASPCAIPSESRRRHSRQGVGAAGTNVAPRHFEAHISGLRTSFRGLDRPRGQNRHRSAQFSIGVRHQRPDWTRTSRVQWWRHPGPGGVNIHDNRGSSTTVRGFSRVCTGSRRRSRPVQPRQAEKRLRPA